jgi:threonine synthase
VGRKLGLPRVYVKDDSRNPSASLKDRATAVALMRAQALGKKVVATASTGNIAASLACLAAGTGLETVVFVPKSTPEAKLAQAAAHGARVIAVPGSYDDAFALCEKACEDQGWYNRSTGYNPVTREGKKTAAYEICEQLDLQAPDVVFCPVGDGNTISALWKGFRDLHALNLIDQVPKLVAVQAEGADSVNRAFTGDGVIHPRPGRTLADSIAVRWPKDGEAAVAALRQSIGDAVTVSDEEISAAAGLLAREEGVFAEPAGAAALAGLMKSKVEETDRVVVMVTGSGLKNPGAVGAKPQAAASLADVRKLAKKWA